MFTIIPLLESNLTIHYAGIFGLQPWAFFIVLFIIVFGAFYIWNKLSDKWKYDKYLKMATMSDGKTRRMNGIFITATGEGYEELCDVDMHEINIKGDKKSKKASGLMFAPKVSTQRIPQYYIHPDFIHTISWPKKRKVTQQIRISEAIYRENFPLPAFSYKEMSETERLEMTSILAGISADQNVANAVVTEIQQKFDAFTKAVKELKNLKLILLLIFVNLILGAVGALLSFQNYNLVKTMMTFFGIH